ncbi:Protoglobin-domain-containing protein [Rhizoctonia solani]|nr:Protoglobin-domain-containing protein [Rhizoctonia solani]
MCPILNRIDPAQLETSLPKRVEYITKFIEFGPEDAAALRAAAPIVKQITNCAVDAVYEKLFSFDVTRATFLSRNTGFDGKLATRLEEITHESEIIKFRKDFLRAWMFKVFTADYTDIKTFEYLDKVGLMHTGPAAFQHREKKEPLHVDYTHCALLLGHVHNMLTRAVLARNLPAETTQTTLVAINKVLWIQNDLFARHYIPPHHSRPEESESKEKGGGQGWGWGLFGRAGGSSSS